MNLKVRFTLIIAVLLSCLGLSYLDGQAAEQTDSAKIEKAVLDTYAEITKGAESLDAEKLFSYVLENNKGALINSGKLTMTRQEAMDDYANNSRNITEIHYAMDKQYVTVLSPEAAIMAVEGRFEAKMADGQTFGSAMAQTVVFVLREGQWKVLHSHTSAPVDR